MLRLRPFHRDEDARGFLQLTWRLAGCIRIGFQQSKGKRDGGLGDVCEGAGLR